MGSQVEIIRTKFESLKPVMDERMRRLWAGAEADALGEGGIAIVEEATGMSRTTIRVGRAELRSGVARSDVVSVRRPGGGRPAIGTDSVRHHPGTREPCRAGHAWGPRVTAAVDLRRAPASSPPSWLNRATKVSPQKVGQLLHASGYSLQATHKTLGGHLAPGSQ